jgi:hypothetical protein
MRTTLEHRAVEIEVTSQDKEKYELSRRALLEWLPILGVGAAAITLGVREAHATPVTDAVAGKANALADDKAPTECKKAEAVDEVDPDDPLEMISAQRGRRVARRQMRRVYRRGRRVSRRVYRRARRRRWICWWRRARRVCGWRWY